MFDNTMLLILPLLPEDEREATQFFVQNCRDLAGIAEDDLPHCVSLYQECWAAAQTDREKRRKFSAWALIGARNAVLQLYGFSETLADMNTNLSKAPTLRAMVDASELKSANKLFSASFPNIAHVRLDAAHPSELANSKAGLAKHAASSVNVAGLELSGKHNFISGTMIGDSYSATIKNQLVSVPITNKTTETLMDICKILETAFAPISEAAIAHLQTPAQGTTAKPTQD
jgi:hypothetical protein